MPAYLVADVTVIGDPAAVAEYRDGVAATLGPFDGRHLVRGPDPIVLEGGWCPRGLVVVEFPDVDTALAWNRSPAYRRIAPLRAANTVSRRIVVAGS